MCGTARGGEATTILVRPIMWFGSLTNSGNELLRIRNSPIKMWTNFLRVCDSDLRDVIIQTLAAFVCYEDSLKAIENIDPAL